MAADLGELREGDLIGGNEIEARIGAGGFGVVYRARDPRGTLVAVKVLTPEGQADPDLVLRLMKEATLLAEIEQDNVVRFHAAGKDGERIWLAMEYVPGGTLRAKLPRHRPIDIEQALRWARHIAEGVAEVHKIHDAVGRPVVHRDLKPENVLLSRDGIAKVTDFGIAKFRTSVKSTASNETLGTPLYMAPEQMDAAADIDGRADVFAVGVILYEMLAGQRPAEVGHEGELTLMEKVTRSITRPVTPLPEVNPEVPGYIWRIVERALEKNRELRTSSMRELADELLDALKRVRRERGKQPSFAEVSAAEMSVPPRATANASAARIGSPTPPPHFVARGTWRPAEQEKEGEGDGRLSTLAASSRSVKLPIPRTLRAPVLVAAMALGVVLGVVVFWGAITGQRGAPAAPAATNAIPSSVVASPPLGSGLSPSDAGPGKSPLDASLPSSEPLPTPPPPTDGPPRGTTQEAKKPAPGPGPAKPQPKQCGGFACAPDF